VGLALGKSFHPFLSTRCIERLCVSYLVVFQLSSGHIHCTIAAEVLSSCLSISLRRVLRQPLKLDIDVSCEYRYLLVPLYTSNRSWKFQPQLDKLAKIGCSKTGHWIPTGYSCEAWCPAALISTHCDVVES